MMADKRTLARAQDPSTQTVVDLLTSILNEVQKQVQSKAPPPLADGTQIALDQFREIGAALALQPLPTITLTADPTQFGVNGGTTRLTWASSNAQRISIEPGVGDVTPVAGGFIEVTVSATTTFTATAQGACGSATASVTVTVQVLQ
jgi:hypothetical protein